MTTLYTGRTTLVTGAGRGFGRSTALRLAHAGAWVVLVARSAGQLDEAADAVAATGADRPTKITADLAGDDDRGALIERAGGHVDVLVHNAGVVEPLGAVRDFDADAARKAFEFNVLAVAGVTATALPAMLDAKWGRIVTVSSGIVADPAGMIGGGVYAASKAALEAWTINLAAELNGSGVTANAYRPGMTNTFMQAWIRSQDPGRIGARLQAQCTRARDDGRLISSDRSADAVVRHLLENDRDASGAVWNVGETMRHAG